MLQYENIFDLIFNNLKKFLYPEDWISLDLDFSKSELFTLLLIDKNGEIIMSGIADYINVSMSTANGIVERLLKKGYLERDRSDSDRRIVVVRLTDRGKELVNELKSVVFEYIRLINEALNDEEQQLLLKVFNKIIDVINKKDSKNKADAPQNQLRKINIE